MKNTSSSKLAPFSSGRKLIAKLIPKVSHLIAGKVLCGLLGVGAVMVTAAVGLLAAPPEQAPGFLQNTAWQRYVIAPTSRNVLPVRVLSSTGDVTNPPGVLGSGVARLRRLTRQDLVPSVTVDFGKVVVGYPKISFAGSSGTKPGVRLAFSESVQYLTDRSDFTRSDYFGGPGTDQHAVPANAVVWTDAKGCKANGKVWADGVHGFRYLKISLDALPSDAPDAQPYGEVDINGISLDFTAYLGTPDTYHGLMTFFPTTQVFQATGCMTNSTSSPTQLDAPIRCQVIVEHFTDERVGELLAREP